MPEKKVNEMVCLKQYISEKEYKEIHHLEKLCFSYDKTNLKLELDYKLHISRRPELGLKAINEFLYYVNDQLVAYLGICSFGGRHVAEINGMTHPDYRKHGFFNRLFELAAEECQKRNFQKVLLLLDGKSISGVNFINSVHAVYEFSEYRMRWVNETNLENSPSVKLRKATKVDGREISKQNARYFNLGEEIEWDFQQEEALNNITYMIEHNEQMIGKIVVSYGDDSALLVDLAYCLSSEEKDMEKKH
ncbi:GNAT family N-acetyltransferase [Anaerobacillus sp. CMMVII]|uniref:GNAT family N-acetyltransferase n=1 Tax=Anaerobacillus sp. CMMVII TaxID=2755588 RepID=UPI0021B7907F|nr:GNAT family N-acetyltransferase [Anaerobacillus sp. CMMVII]